MRGIPYKAESPLHHGPTSRWARQPNRDQQTDAPGSQLGANKQVGLAVNQYPGRGEQAQRTVWGIATAIEVSRARRLPQRARSPEREGWLVPQAVIIRAAPLS